MKRRRLSSSTTIFWKFILPAIWFPLYAWVLTLAFRSDIAEGILFLLGYLMGSFILYYGFLRSKKVHIDQDYLYLSNFRKSVRVPLKEVEMVSENMMIAPRIIFVKFKKQTDFGSEIMFVGYTKLFNYMRPHPAVQEIKSRIHKRS